MGKQDLIIIASLSGVMISLRLLIYYFEKVIERNTSRCCGDCNFFEVCFHYVDEKRLYTNRNYTERPACESFKEKSEIIIGGENENTGKHF